LDLLCYALWLCLFKAGQTVLFFSIGEREAAEMLRRVKELYNRIPPGLKLLLPKRIKSNTTEQEFSNGSSIQSLPGVGGRSFTASLIVLDEFAHNERASELYTGVKPTIDGGGQLIILSTANGIGNAFHRLWVMAKSGSSPLQTVFLPWWTRPGRDDKWYAETKAGYEDPSKMVQEYPANDIEAFLSSGRSRFAAEWIARQQENVRSPIPVDRLPNVLRALHTSCTIGSNVNLCIYQGPIPGRRYILAADVAEGLAKGDYSTATIIDAESWEEVAHIHGHWEPAVYAGYIQILGEFYGALIAVERNNHGHAVLATLAANGCSNVYENPEENPPRPGWVTNLKTKPLSIDNLAEALRDDLCKIRTAATLDELQIYAVDDKGKTGAPDNYHDDRVMTWAILMAIVRHPVEHVGKPVAGGDRKAQLTPDAAVAGNQFALPPAHQPRPQVRNVGGSRIAGPMLGLRR